MAAAAAAFRHSLTLPSAARRGPISAIREGGALNGRLGDGQEGGRGVQPRSPLLCGVILLAASP